MYFSNLLGAQDALDLLDALESPDELNALGQEEGSAGAFKYYINTSGMDSLTNFNCFMDIFAWSKVPWTDVSLTVVAKTIAA